jgi:hypothetical protein
MIEMVEMFEGESGRGGWTYAALSIGVFVLLILVVVVCGLGLVLVGLMSFVLVL